MKLRDLLRELNGWEAKGSLDTEIGAVCANSRERTDRGVFFCVPGARFDAHDFAPQAVRNGCAALVVDHFLPDVEAAQIKVDNVRAAMAVMTAEFYGWPSRHMRMVGITGTKGKTTTSYMVKAICEHAGLKCGLIGTTGNMIGDRRMDSHLTTPDPVELQLTLRQMLDEGVQVVCMEVSAHAIDMHRLEGMSFEVGCYTNLSQDHLDYFHTMKAYFETKKSFFTSGMVRNAVINADDDTSADILRCLKVPRITYGISVNADLFARDIEKQESGWQFTTVLQSVQKVPIHLQMLGTFNVYNALAAAGCAMVLGISEKDIREGLESVKSVPGRVELLETHTPYKVVLDYSHSPDALRNILETLRVFTRGRLIALFGCGGDRDQGKRPIMGRIGGELADYCILTSDNPRTEDPMDILRAVEEGIRPTGKPYTVIENRREAIRTALQMAEEGDVIVLAGKGHETYQEIRGVKHPFDEKVVVSELLDEMHPMK